VIFNALGPIAAQKMYTLFTLLCLVPMSLGTAIRASEGTSENRDGKFISIFEIVKFDNDMCTASDGNMGVCYTEKECNKANGVATGKCAEDYGVCCVFKANTCGDTLDQAVTYIESPNYPAMAPTGECKFNVKKCDANVCQYKIDFDMVMMAGPDMGDCNNDTLKITSIDAASAKLVPDTLCGDLSGQSIYVDVEDTTDVPMFTFNIDSDMAKWRIKVQQIACKSEDLAPFGCLTYNTETSGMIMSFNNQNGGGQLINDQKYTHCIKNQKGYCDVSFVSDDFDLDNDDFITFGTTTLTDGNCFSDTAPDNCGALTHNFTGPYTIPFCSGGMNTAMNSGYSLAYLLLPC